MEDENVIVRVQYPDNSRIMDFSRCTRQQAQVFLDGGYENFDFPNGTKLHAVDDWGFGEVIGRLTIGDDDAP